MDEREKWIEEHVAQAVTDHPQLSKPWLRKFAEDAMGVADDENEQIIHRLKLEAGYKWLGVNDEGKAVYNKPAVPRRAEGGVESAAIAYVDLWIDGKAVNHPAAVMALCNLLNNQPRAEGGVREAITNCVLNCQVPAPGGIEDKDELDRIWRQALINRLVGLFNALDAPSPVDQGGVREALIKEVSQFYSSVEDTSLTQQRIDALREHARTVLNAPTTPLEEVVVDEIETLVTQNDKNLIVDKVRAILTLGDRVRVLVTKEKP